MKLFRGFKSFFVQKLSPASPDGWTVRAGTETVTATSALALSAVWACRNLICGTIATMPCSVYRTSGEARVEAREHPLWRVLHDSPNYDQTAVDFWDFLSSSIELRGNGYARVLRERGAVVGLVPIYPDIVSVRRLKSGAIEYRWTDEGRQHVCLDTEMLHVRGPGGNPLGGMSTLAFGGRTFGLARSADQAAAGVFENGLRPSGVMQFKDWLSPQNRAVAEEKLGAKFVGAVNAGKPMFLEGGAEWRPLTINPEDAQMLESRSFSVEEICRFFGVPPFMVGHTEKSTSWGTGIEQQTLAFQKFTLRARLKRIEQAVAKQLLTAEDRASGVVIEFNLEGLLRGDSKARADYFKAALGTTQVPGWMVRNEVRRIENLPPVDGWDDPIPLLTTAPTAALPKPDSESAQEDEE